MSGASPEAQGRPLLLDTHTWIWLADGNRKLGESSKEAIRSAYRESMAIVSAITPWEIALLVSKGRVTLEQDVLGWIRASLAIPGLRLVLLEPEIAVASTRFPFEMHADSADRILVATARHLGATLVTADRALLELAKSGHFRAMDAGL